MNIARNIKLWGMTAAALAATVTLASSAPTVWYNTGWRTPRYIDENVKANVADFRAEYHCDKLKGEIKRVQLMDNTAPEKVPELMRLQKIYDDAECAKFEF